MTLYNEIMNIKIDESSHDFKYSYEVAYVCGFRDARHAAAELSLKAEARIEELENALQDLYIASGPVANCAYNVGQQHEDWENIRNNISILDTARAFAIKIHRGEG